MKKFLYLASGAAIALASCSDDLNLKTDTSAGIEGVSTIYASMADGQKADTRTSVELVNGNYVFYWNPGDALGVIGATQAQSVNNAQFAYNSIENSTNGEFKGQINIPKGNSYYAYYPYNSSLNLDLADSKVLTEPNKDGTNGSITIPLSISANQTFNYVESDYISKPSGKADGSFSAGAVPAVGYASATEENALNFSFSPQASYLVFPIQGLGTIQSLTLKIDATAIYNNLSNKFAIQTISGKDYYNLAGPLDVTVSTDPSVLPNASFNPTSQNYDEDFSYEITLNCGNYQLKPDQATNFWFVVPAGLELQGTIINIDVDGTINGEASPATLTRDLSNWAPVQGTKTIKNYVTYLGQTASSFFTYGGDYTVINTPQQFLEYAYLVTNGAAAYTAWTNAGGTSLSGSSLAQMVETSGTGTSTTISKVKPAYISNELTFSVSDIQDWIQGISSDYMHNAYYSAVYGNYIQKGYIQPIGGEYAFTIEGATTTTTTEATEDEEESTVTTVVGGLNGLKVQGNQMFSPASGAEAKLLNLNLNMTVDASAQTGKYAFLTVTGNYLEPTNVIVGAGSKLVQPEPEETDAPSATADATANDIFANGWLYYNYYTSWGEALPGKVYSVVNNSSMLYANTLQINNAVTPVTFDFTVNKDINVNAFGIMNLNNNNTDGAVLKVNGSETNAKAAREEAATIISKMVNEDWTGYSIIDNVADPYNGLFTSYWTGTKYMGASLGYAENMAYYVQNNGSSAIKLGSYNLNLMGFTDNYTTVKKPFLTWLSGYTSSSNTPSTTDKTTISGNSSVEKGVKIHNVYIDGTTGMNSQYLTKYTTTTESNNTPKLKNTLYLSLFNFNTTATNLFVDNVTIINETEVAPYISMIAPVPSDECTVTIGSYLPITSKVNVAVGGLFAGLNNETIEYVEDCALTSSLLNWKSLGQNVLHGDIAGKLDLTVKTNTVITNPMPSVAQANQFGKINITVDGSNANNLLQLNGYVPGLFDLANLAPIAGATAGTKYTLVVNYMNQLGTATVASQTFLYEQTSPIMWNWRLASSTSSNTTPTTPEEAE